MEIEKLDRAVTVLKDAILHFPLGANTKDDFKPIEEKIVDIRNTLTAMNARCLTLKALINLNSSADISQTELIKSFEKLNENTSNYLINKRALKLCYQSKAIQDIIYKNEGSKIIQAKVKSCLKKLFIINDKIMSKIEKRKELMKKQYHLRLKSYHAIYDYQDFLKEKEARKNQQLEENDPNIILFKEKINRSISKIYTMKKLITNLIAAMCNQLHSNKKLVEMLAKHKEVISYETIKELAQTEANS